MKKFWNVFFALSLILFADFAYADVMVPIHIHKSVFVASSPLFLIFGGLFLLFCFFLLLGFSFYKKGRSKRQTFIFIALAMFFWGYNVFLSIYLMDPETQDYLYRMYRDVVSGVCISWSCWPLVGRIYMISYLVFFLLLFLFIFLKRTRKLGFYLFFIFLLSTGFNCYLYFSSSNVYEQLLEQGRQRRQRQLRERGVTLR